MTKNAKDQVSQILFERVLTRNSRTRTIPYGAGLLFSGSTPSRPMPRFRASPVQCGLWEFFSKPQPVKLAVEFIQKKSPETGVWDILFAMTELERKRILLPKNTCTQEGLDERM